ncbi:MAG: hypothetical protein L6V93_06180 [Clostridiales bacterium]|nr:MAG: hypothetical protein L6V93_06180 [Clostridiales bacterium]
MPSLWRKRQKLHKLSDYLADKDNESISETALFVDLESNYYIGCDADYPMNELQMRNMNLTAIPWDNYLTDDLLNENFDYDKYKLYIFPNLFKPKKEILEKIQLFAQDGQVPFCLCTQADISALTAHTTAKKYAGAHGT